jgi:hypothetical protein
MRQIGAVMGIAIFSVILQSNMVGAMKVHAAEIPNLPPAAQKVLVDYVAGGGLYGMPQSGPNGLAARLAAAMGASQAARPALTTAQADQMMKQIGLGIDGAMKASFTDSLNRAFLMAALIGAGAVLVAFFIAGGARAARKGAKRIAPESDDAEEALAVGE